MTKKVTMKDIAREAGVSVMTVSYVLNNTKNQTISEATRKKVLKTAESLQYVPNAAAKSLRTSHASCIGVVAGQNISQRRLAAALEGIRRTLEHNSYDMLLTSGRAKEGELPAYVDEFVRNRIDGVLYISHDGIPIPENEKALLSHWNIPAAALDADVGETGFPAVEFDYYHSAAEHTAHLIEKKITDFLYVRPNCDTVQEREREAGIRNALLRHPEDSLVVLTVPSGDLEKQQEDLDLASFFREKLAAALQSLPDHSAVICSWGIYMEYVYAAVLASGKMIWTAGLARGGLSESVWENLSYNVMPDDEAGARCAMLLLTYLKDHTAKREIVLPKYVESLRSSF